MVVEQRGAWARVQDASGSSWWVDGRLLPTAGAAPAGAPRSGGGSGAKWLIGLVVVAAAAVAVFLLTRDGGGGQVSMDDLTPEERVVAESASDAIVSGGDWGMGLLEDSGMTADDLGVGQAEFDCMAAGLTRDLGIERLEELGVTDGVVTDGSASLSQLTPEERETVSDRAFGCIDFKDVFGKALAAQGMDSSVGTCLYDAIGEDTFKDLFTTALTGQEVELEEDDPMVANLFAAATQCLGGDIFGELGEELGGFLGD